MLYKDSSSLNTKPITNITILPILYYTIVHMYTVRVHILKVIVKASMYYIYISIYIYIEVGHSSRT